MDRTESPQEPRPHTTGSASIRERTADQPAGGCPIRWSGVPSPAMGGPTALPRGRAPAPVRWARDHPQAADGLLAVVLAIGAVGALVGHDHPAYDVTPGLVLLAVASALPLAARRRHPVVV